jgi:hypothetical protein
MDFRMPEIGKDLVSMFPQMLGESKISRIAEVSEHPVLKALLQPSGRHGQAMPRDLLGLKSFPQRQSLLKKGEVDHHGLSVGADGRAGGPQGVTGLKRMSSLHAFLTAGAPAHVHTEFPSHFLDHHLLLRLNFDACPPDRGFAAGRAIVQDGLVLLIKTTGRLAMGMPPIGLPGFAARPLGIGLGRSLGVGRMRAMLLALQPLDDLPQRAHSPNNEPSPTPDFGGPPV